MSDDYWFDAAPLTEKVPRPSDRPDSARQRFRSSWTGGSITERIAAVRAADVKGMAADWWEDVKASGGTMSRFAAANGLSYESQQYDQHPRNGEALDGMIFGRGERRKTLRWGDPTTVEFGNWSTVGQELELAFGYIAIRHDLGLPHVIIDARANDATPPRGSRIYAKRTDYTSLSENYRGSNSASPLGRIRGHLETLDLGTESDQHFQAYAYRGRAAQARAFLSGERLRMLTEFSKEFDVEITGDWIYLYATGIEVSTYRPERWAWVFSVASRLFDHVQAWRTAAGEPPSVERPQFHTDRTVARPADLEQLPTPSPGWQAFWDFWDPHT